MPHFGNRVRSTTRDSFRGTRGARPGRGTASAPGQRGAQLGSQRGSLGGARTGNIRGIPDARRVVNSASQRFGNIGSRFQGIANKSTQGPRANVQGQLGALRNRFGR